MGNSSIIDSTGPQDSLHQESFLKQVFLGKYLVYVYLISGIKLQGYITAIDKYAIFLRSANTEVQLIPQMVYKNAISTITVVGNHIGKAAEPE